MAVNLSEQKMQIIKRRLIMEIVFYTSIDFVLSPLIVINSTLVSISS